MKSQARNPSSNALGGGVDEAKLSEAIAKSGYPLQSAVVDSILETFSSDGEYRNDEDRGLA